MSIYLETKRLVIRDYNKGDFDEYFRLKNDEKTMFYLQDIMLRDELEARVDFENVLQDKEIDDRKFYFLHMELKSNHEQIGSIGYTVSGQTPVGKLVHAGYFSYPKYWGNGYMTEAFQEVIRYAFEENNVYRVTTGCIKENKGSERVMLKCGLIKEAEHVNYQWHDGKMRTRLEYRLLKSEWEGMCR